MAEIPANKNKLPVLFFAISACVALAFYVGIVKNETIFYFHFFYIPTILAGMWYHRKATYVALGLGMVHIFVTFFSLHPVSLNEFGRAAILITVAYIIGFASERQAKAEKELIVSEKELRENKDYLDNIIESSADAIVVVDMNGIVRSWNKGAEGYMGYTADEVIGTSNRKLFADQKEADRIMEMVQRSGEVKNYRTIVLNKGGKPVHINMSAALLRDRNGVPVGTIRISRDITERNRAELLRHEKERLEYASKAMSEFLASMSHELRTPLTVINSYLEMFQDGMLGELKENQKDKLVVMRSQTDHIIRLVEDLLDLSKVEAGKIELIIEKISVPETINETIILIKEKAVKHNVLLKKQLDPQLEFIEADMQRLKQVLFNLLSNAVKFSKGEGGGTVTISTKKVKDVAQFSISDTGIGIKPENMGKLFQKFEQLEPEISNKYGGTGLGLAISKQLVEMHGGRMWAESKYGEGSTFTFTLPIKN